MLMLFSSKTVKIQETAAAKVPVINPFKVLNNCILYTPEDFIRHLRRQCQHQNKVVKFSGLHVCGEVNRQVFGVFIDLSQ